MCRAPPVPAPILHFTLWSIELLLFVINFIILYLLSKCACLNKYFVQSHKVCLWSQKCVSVCLCLVTKCVLPQVCPDHWLTSGHIFPNKFTFEQARGLHVLCWSQQIVYFHQSFISFVSKFPSHILFLKLNLIPPQPLNKHNPVQHWPALHQSLCLVHYTRQS